MKRQAADIQTPPAEQVPLASLKGHPRNYRQHPEDQIEHLAASIREHGLYRNIVTANDGTILAGHGVALAAAAAGLESVPVVRLPIEPDSPAALKVLTGDNEIEHLAEQDDRALSELLREIALDDPLALLGTGFDEAMLANLVYVTRPASEIADMDEAAHWVGMPEYAPADGDRERLRLTVSFAGEADRADFYRRLGIDGPRGQNASIWWPLREKDDPRSLRLEESVA